MIETDRHWFWTYPDGRPFIRTLNELEGTALGIVQRTQPCTAYSLRLVLGASPSSHWRGSAGAIYPLLARLEKEQLIASAKDAEDGRGRKLLSITPRGREALGQWIAEISDPNLISEVSDPLRTRIFFLSVLTPDEQVIFIDKALAALKQHLIIAEQHLAERPAEGDLFEHLGAKGGVLNAESRIQFMQWVSAQIRRA